jgi:hypothetical protein
MIILPVVLYGYETWCPTLREEHRLKVFVNGVMSREVGLEMNTEKGYGCVLPLECRLKS